MEIKRGKKKFDKRNGIENKMVRISTKKEQNIIIEEKKLRWRTILTKKYCKKEDEKYEEGKQY